MGTFSGKKIKNTYQGIVQYSGSKFYDALGNQIISSIEITSSYATFSETSTSSDSSSYVEGQNVDGFVEFAVSAISSSYAVTASYASTSSPVVYSSLTGIPTGIVSSSTQIETQISGAFDTVSASLASTIKNIIDGVVTVATASYAISASHEISYELSSSYADFALTASHALNIADISALNDFTGSAGSRLDSLEAVTGSYLTGADTGSFATTESNNFQGTQSITGSLLISSIAEFGGNLIPKTPQGATLGTLEKPFSEIFVSSGSINIASDILGETNTSISNTGGNLLISAGGMKLLGSASFIAETGSFSYLSGSLAVGGDVTIFDSLTVQGSILGTITSASYSITASYAESTPSISGVSGTGLGWARYDDGVYTTGSVFNVTVAEGEVTLPNSGSSVINSHMHSTVEFYDSSSAKIQVENENDVYMQTVVFKAKTSHTNGTYVRIQLDSTVGTPYERVGKDLFFPKGNNVWHEFHEVFQYYADSDFVSNGNRWKIQAFSHDVEVADIVYFIQRTQNHGVE